MEQRDVLKVVERYREHFARHGIAKIALVNPESASVSPQQALQHCYVMLDWIREALDDGDLEKAQRWLGIVQGCLFALGRFSLREIHCHNCWSALQEN